MGEPQYDMQDVIIADLAQQLAQSRVEVERLKVIESEHLRVSGGWRCFHCGVWFLDETAARAHFQDRTDNPADQKPAWCCQALDRAEARQEERKRCEEIVESERRSHDKLRPLSVLRTSEQAVCDEILRRIKGSE